MNRQTPSFLSHALLWLRWPLLAVGGLGLLAAARARLLSRPRPAAPPSAPPANPTAAAVEALRDESARLGLAGERIAPPEAAGPAMSERRLPPALFAALLVGAALALLLLSAAAPEAAQAALAALLLLGLGTGLWQGRHALSLSALVNAGRAARAGAAHLLASVYAGARTAAQPALVVARPVGRWLWRGRGFWAGLAGGIAAALAIFSAMAYRQPLLGPDSTAAAFLAMLGCFGAAALALLLHPAPILSARVTPAPLRAARPLPIVTGLGLAALALTAEINGMSLNIEGLAVVSSHVQMGLLAGGLALLAWGLIAPRWTPAAASAEAEAEKDYEQAWRDWRFEVGALLAILALAFVVRYWNLGTAVRYMVDEMNTVPEVNVFWPPETPVRVLTQMSGISPFPWVFAYFQTAGVMALGRNLAGLRCASTITGVLTVLALYPLAKALFDRRTALIAALLLASFPPHIHFSRLALLNIADPLVGTAALAFLARGMTANRRADWVLGGMFLGLTLYFYNGGRMFYIPLAAGWIALGMLLWRPRPSWRGLRLALAMLALTAAPVLYTAFASGDPLFGRMEASGLSADYWRQMIESGNFSEYGLRLGWAFRFYVQGFDDTVYYGGDTPLVLPLLVPLFLLGGGVALGMLRRPGGLLLALAVIGAGLGNSILIVNAASTRFVIVFPMLPLLVAVGLRCGLPLLWPPRFPALALRISLNPRRALRLRWPPRHPDRHLRRAMAALALLAAAAQVVYYFGPHLETYNWQLRLRHAFPDGYDAILRALDFPDGTHLHIISASPFSQMDGQGFADYVDGGLIVHTQTTSRFNSFYLSRLACGVDHAFFFLVGDAVSPALLARHRFVHAPAYSPYAAIIPDERELVLYYAPHVPGLETTRCR